jgi:hypothetical protein
MKKLLAILGILFVSTGTIYAQNGLSVSYDTFKLWMKHSLVNGFNFVESDQEKGDYTASFMQLNKMIGVRMLPVAEFETYKSAKGYDGSKPYDYKGAKLVYVGGPSSSMLFILSSKVNATVIVATSYFKCDKSAIEKIAVELGLGSKF